MKKKNLNLSRKLLLNKVTISALDSGQQSQVAGGATITLNCCLTQTCPANSNPCKCIQTVGCPTQVQGCPSVVLCPITNNPADTQCQGGTATDILCCVQTINGPNC